jgi:Bacterial Ig-like domain
MKPTIQSALWLMVITFVLIQCASEASPGGGPPDTTPPFLISSTIVSGDTKVPQDLILKFTFSENLNTDLAEKSITIFPLIEDITSTIARGRTISISPLSGWDPDIVYTVILGKNISDYRGNKLPEPLQFSFTSGNKIPQNAIKGQVLQLNPGKTAVICISRKTSFPDSILAHPEYYTQSNEDGSFIFEYLPSNKFYLAGYIDLDNSNNYKDKFDGICIPTKTNTIPDTLSTLIYFEAINDNFIPGQLLKAESIDPSETKFSFAKIPAVWNDPGTFKINTNNIDTALYDDKTCTIYHDALSGDSLDIELIGLYDHLAVPIPDTTLRIAITAWADSFYNFQTLGDYLRITPPPLAETIPGIFQTKRDTTELILKKHLPGFYTLPVSKTSRAGTWLVQLPQAGKPLDTENDSLYSIPLNLKAGSEYGSVIGRYSATDTKGLRFVLHNSKQSYDIPAYENVINFAKVLPGSYSLSFYVDENSNARRDIGLPYPFIKPEILLDLDKNIDVRARWDTELEEPYKIVIENE